MSGLLNLCHLAVTRWASNKVVTMQQILEVIGERYEVETVAG